MFEYFCNLLQIVEICFWFAFIAFHGFPTWVGCDIVKKRSIDDATSWRHSKTIIWFARIPQGITLMFWQPARKCNAILPYYASFARRNMTYTERVFVNIGHIVYSLRTMDNCSAIRLLPSSVPKQSVVASRRLKLKSHSKFKTNNFGRPNSICVFVNLVLLL